MESYYGDEVQQRKSNLDAPRVTINNKRMTNVQLPGGEVVQGIRRNNDLGHDGAPQAAFEAPQPMRQLNASLIALPYIDEDYKMLIFHPLESSSVKELENKLFSSNETIEQYSSELKKTEISLLFPKFETGSDMSLVKPFQKLGVTDIFGDRANFTGITDDNNIKVGDIIHKTKLTVSEEGSEAAAVSGAVLDTRSGPVRKKINIDSPFIFYIYDTKRQIPLFMGKIVDPSKDNKEPLHSLDNPLEKDQEIFSSTKASVDDDKLKPEDEDRIKFEEEVSTKSSTKVCPGGDLDTCIDSCDFETTREHRICIRSCAQEVTLTPVLIVAILRQPG